MNVSSSDGVDVVVHDFGGSGPPLLISHATGFHAHCYLPIARALGDHFHVFAHDHRGHGETDRPDDWQVVWERYGDDTIAAAERIAPDGGLVAFGHSMGGATLLMAAHRNPGLFDLIVAFEPIVFPIRPDDEPVADSPMVVAARNRRDTFDSAEAAIANYASKPPMQFFDPEVLELYVRHGFAPNDDGGVTLRCAPEHEARTFESGGVHRLWTLLPEITTRTIVIAGAVDDERSPAGIAAGIAGQLPNSEYVEWSDGNHLTPFIEPGRVADFIRDSVGSDDVG